MKKCKKIGRLCQDYIVWLILLIITDVLYGGFLWLADVEAFFVLFGLMFFISLILFGIAIFYIYRKERNREVKVMDFLDTLDKTCEIEACNLLAERECNHLKMVGEILRENESILKEQEMHLNEYEEYIELWAHEVKIPLSLVTLMLDNRKDEISPNVYWKMEYARNQIQEYVNQMLYYARLKAVYKDYLFEEVCLDERCTEVLQEFQVFLEEQDFKIEKCLGDSKVVTDRKGFHFILGQVISNAVKYKRREEKQPIIKLEATVDENRSKVCLRISDNGIGVKAYDLPYLFDKGFTSDGHENQRKSTGMGLYLVKQMADELNITVEIESEYQKDFAVLLIFPI